MVEHKHSTIITKSKGSALLLSKLQKGDLKKISDQFGIGYYSVRGIIIGKHAGDSNIVECAERIVAFYDKIGLESNVEHIIKSYGDSNGN